MVKNIKYDKRNKSKTNENNKDPKKKLTPSYQEDQEIEQLKARYKEIDPKNITSFKDFPFSKKTLKGLKESEYKIPTDIQKQSIGYSLQGKDILGAAMTGSGKTLAFLIPILETLFIKKWTRLDGVGAIVITPTRELAYQIFETLKKIGPHHDFSAGLVIGGKNLKFEKKRMDQCNIIICTPGRLLQHMDENPLFNCDSMQILVLDEADRCLDLGFQATMNAIIENFPADRQTLLFSATQTKSVKDLARLSLKSPVYVAPHEQQAHVTPEKLQQSYVICNLEDKVTMLWSFVRQHKKSKIIVFMSSCKQVKYIYEIFCKLRPGISLIALYGTLSQDRRVNVYNEFCRKSNVVLFATDIASRGLDFPEVNWVVQLDCPEDAVAYIHRAGRTARFNASGENLLVLLPSEEEGMLEELLTRKIEIEKISIDMKFLFSPRVKIEAYLAQKKELKESAQRAFIAYIKSVALMKNKKVFKVEELNIDGFARSLGLIVTPRVRFLERFRKRLGITPQISNENNHPGNSKTDFNSLAVNSDDDDDGDEVMTIKRRNHEIEEELAKDETPLEEIKAKTKVVSKASVAKKVLKKKIVANKKVVFDDDGKAVVDTAKQLQSELGQDYLNEDDNDCGIDIEKAKQLIREEDKFDKQRFKELVKARHKEKKQKLKKKKIDDEEEKDEFGTDDDDNEDEPDLSWLPDPNKVYGSDNSANESDEREELIHRPPKKLYTKKDKNFEANVEEPPRKKKKKNIVSDLSLNEAEAIAMKLLGKNV